VMVGHDGHRGWLYYVASDPQSRGAGFGRQIVEAGENWLRQRGVAKVQLLVRETNTQVVAFYEHLGFEVAPRTVLAKWLRND
jgi:ribosomal protein S18 acetylase RimI-like enzyme